MALIEVMKEEETTDTATRLPQFVKSAFHDESLRQVKLERYQIST